MENATTLHQPLRLSGEASADNPTGLKDIDLALRRLLPRLSAQGNTGNKGDGLITCTNRQTIGANHRTHRRTFVPQENQTGRSDAACDGRFAPVAVGEQGIAIRIKKIRRTKTAQARREAGDDRQPMLKRWDFASFDPDRAELLEKGTECLFRIRLANGGIPG